MSEQPPYPLPILFLNGFACGVLVPAEEQEHV